MSPAPQANLEVERYIGSYLISQRVPPNVKSPPGNKRYSSHHVKPKNGPTDSEKVRNFNKYCYPQREPNVASQGRYPMGPGQLPMAVEYGGSNCHFGKHTGWAGMPLISMTHRRYKKVPSTTNTSYVPQKYSPKPQGQQNNYPKGKESDENTPSDNSSRSPLTRLAIHTQGAPLIQAGRYGCRNNFSREPTTRGYRGETAPRWEAARDTKPSPVVQNKDQATRNTDNLSVASDESSGNSENSLPRIIKPRKRRKKDRKPITSTNGGTTSTPNEQVPDSPTLKSFLPLMTPENSREENTTSELATEVVHVSSKQGKQIEDLIDPDEFPFGNLLDDEDDDCSEVSCAPATLCQCRYCDPSGVIWDVDQRCYSPFLTPPSPTNPLAFNGRPYNSQTPPFSGDLGSLLRRSWSTPVAHTTDNNRSSEDSRPTSPLGLQVSSEIVTSPNGHRDIEIKFFLSSSPPESSKGRISVSERDRYLVAEE